MPPKIKITKSDIIQAALEMVKEKGVASVNARSLATALNCSTQPIFSNFSTMDELQEAIKGSAYECYLSFLKRELDSKKYPEYKALGIAYIRFAREERELFRLLFMCDRQGQDLTPTEDFKASVEIIVNSLGITRERAELMHLEMWACVHGIATMLATSFLSLDWELVSAMLTDTYMGLKAKHLNKEG